MSKILSYKDLEVWKKAVELTTLIYKISKDFPKEEIYGLTSQMHRASCSISLNIAEGYGRKSTQSYLHFLKISRGSIMELENCLIISNNLNYLNKENFNQALADMETVMKMMNALIRSIKMKLENSSSSYPNA